MLILVGEQMMEIKILHKQGESLGTIAGEVGIYSVNTIRKYLKYLVLYFYVGLIILVSIKELIMRTEENYMLFNKFYNNLICYFLYFYITSITIVHMFSIRYFYHFYIKLF